MSRHPNSMGTAVLRALSSLPGATTAELATATGLTRSQVIGALKYGRLCGLVDTDRQGMTRHH